MSTPPALPKRPSSQSIVSASSSSIEPVSVNAHPLLLDAASPRPESPWSQTNAGYAVTYQPRTAKPLASRPSASHPASPPAKAKTVAQPVTSSAAFSRPALSPSGSSTFATAQSSETATSKLQLQNLQAEVQAAGLRPDSLGWALLLAIVNGSASPGLVGAEKPAGTSTTPSSKGKEREKDVWDRMMNLLENPTPLDAGTANPDIQLTLLLPKDASSAVVDSSILADHILLCGPAVLEGRVPVATLSGLRGVLEECVFSCISITLFLTFLLARSS